MTTYNKIFTALVATGFSLSASAATTSVSTVADLIAAVQGASDGDEIVVMDSGSPYEFSTGQKDVVAHLYARVRITLRGSTGNPDDVVLVGNANRILYLAQAGNSISNLTFRSGDCTGYEIREDAPKDQLRGGAICSVASQDSTTIIQKCVFKSCRSAKGGGACGIVTANDAYCGKYIDCTFADNETGGSGGAIYNAYSIQGCTFSNNSATFASSVGGAVSGAKEIARSTFTGNSLSVQGENSSRGGGAVYLSANDEYSTATISDCTFAANSVDNQYGGAIRGGHPGLSVVNCVFAGNSTSSGYGGAVYDVPSVVSCVFSNNCTTTGRGGALAHVELVSGCSIVSNAASLAYAYGGGVYDCTLRGCYVASNYAYRCGAAADCRLYFCTNEANSADGLYELGKQSTGCYAEDCTFLNAGGIKRKAIFGQSGFNRCRFLNTGRGYVFSQFVAMTNCLIYGTGPDGTSNSILFFNLKDSASSMVNCTIVSNKYTLADSCSTPNMMNIKNCFFYGNTVGGESGRDIDGSTSPFVASIENCILSAADNSYIPDYATSDTLNIYGTAFKPGFVGADDPENPFSLTRRSPAVAKAGLVEDWMASATDIRGEGFPRLRDGKVNIGCYQCWEAIPGFSIIIR